MIYAQLQVDISTIQPTTRPDSGGLANAFLSKTTVVSESMADNDAIADWLDNMLNVTGNIKDIVVVAELYHLIKDDGATSMTNSEFKRLCKAHLKSKSNVVFRDMDIVVEPDRRKYMRNTIRGVLANRVEH